MECLHVFVVKLIMKLHTQYISQARLITVEPVYSGHHGDNQKWLRYSTG